MKNSILLSLFVFSLFVVSCGGPEGTKVASEDAVEVANTAPAAAYTVDAAASSIKWTGTKLVGGGHEGVINITEGKLALTGDKIVGGKFTIDMNSLACTDLADDQGKGKLEGHLKSGDFFDVEAFPMATFEIASVSPVTGTEGITHSITGNLTMKGQARSITIPANVSMADGMLKASAPDFVIDRTEWGVEYGSGTSFADLAKDNIINDNIGLSLMLVAKK